MQNNKCNGIQTSNVHYRDSYLGNIYGYNCGYDGSVFRTDRVAKTIVASFGGGSMHNRDKEVRLIAAQTSRVVGGEFVSCDRMNLINIGMEVSGSILARYGRGIEGDHSMCVIEIKSSK